jgi:hypothetical protein
MKTAGFFPILFALGIFSPVLAQMTGGSISGKVTDASDAAISGATLTIQNQATGETRALHSNERGFYNQTKLESEEFCGH